MCYSIWAPGLLLPFLLGLYLRRTTARWVAFHDPRRYHIDPLWQTVLKEPGYPPILVGLAASAPDILLASCLANGRNEDAQITVEVTHRYTLFGSCSQRISIGCGIATLFAVIRFVVDIRRELESS